MVSLAIPTFTGIPDDTIKKIDAYKDVDTSLQNSLVSKISAFDTNLDGIIHGSLSTLSGIGDKLAKGEIDPLWAQERIRSALGGSRSAISDIAQTLENEIFGDLTGTDAGTGYVRGANQMADSVKLVMDGVTRTFIQNDYKSVSGVVGFLRDLTGNQLIETFDLGAQAALVRGVLSTVTKWGVPELVDEAFGAKWNTEKDIWEYEYDDEFRFSVTKRASDNISPSTSLAVINTLMLHGGDKALVADNPDFPSQLIAGYVLPEGCVAGGPYPVDPAKPYGDQTQSNYAYEGWLLKDILNRLKPDWFYTKRTYATGVANAPFATDTVWNLQSLPRASEAAKAVLSTDKDLQSALLAAPFYRVESGIAMMKLMYPYFVE